MAAVTNLTFNRIQSGDIQFSSVDVDMNSLAGFLQGYIVQGSKRYQISRREMACSIAQGTVRPNPMTLRFLLNQGNPLFNSLFCLADGDAALITERPPGIDANPKEPDAVAKALFVQYFFIMVRGSVSVADDTTPRTTMPNFLGSVMTCNETPLTYARRLSSFPLGSLNPGWVRFIQTRLLGPETINRFGLGLAGYRNMAAFKFLTRPNNIPANLVRPYEVACSMATQPASWDLHPATRRADVLQRYGPLNKNLFNLTLELWTQAELQELVDSKALYEMPTRTAGVTNYRTWTHLWVTPVDSLIFPPVTN